MRFSPALVVVALLAGFSSLAPAAHREGHPAAPPPTDSAPPKLEFGGGDGNGCDRAVVIRGSRGSRDIVAGEIAWLRARYPGYKFRDNTVETRGGRTFEEIRFDTAAGEAKAVCFEITEGFGHF